MSTIKHFGVLRRIWLTCTAVLLGLLVPTLVSASVPPAEPSPRMVSSWPRDGFEILVPIREGRLSFNVPVRASSLTLVLTDPAGAVVPGELLRLTRGESVTDIFFQFPTLPQGSYQVAWSVSSTSGSSFSGTISFARAAPLEIAGGGNHRIHDQHLLYKDTFSNLLLRYLFVLSVALLFVGFYRTHTRHRPSRVDSILVRVGGGVLLFASILSAAHALATSSSTGSVSSALASPWVWNFFPLALLAVFALRFGKSNVFALWAAVAVTVLSAGSTHLVAPTGFLLFTSYLTLFTAAALLNAGVLVVVAATLRNRITEVSHATRRLFDTLVVMAAASFATVFLHARSVRLVGDFVSDLIFRGVVAAISFTALFLATFLSSRSKKSLRLLSIFLFMVLIICTSLLLRLPPSTAGL